MKSLRRDVEIVARVLHLEDARADNTGRLTRRWDLLSEAMKEDYRLAAIEAIADLDQTGLE